MARWLALVGAILLAAAPARAEVGEIRIARGFPISYLPLMVMEQEKLLERHIQAAGIGPVTVAYGTFPSPAATTDALMSGQVDVVAGGVPTLITLWARTRGNLGVRGIGAVSAMPVFLNTRNPAVRTIRDFGPKDRIALPSIKLSFQAIVLQMAAEQAFGPGRHEQLDGLTVSLGHPDAIVAMRMPGGEISADFTAPPFQYLELEEPGVRRVLSSYEVLGGPATFNALWTTQKFHDANPRLYRAFLAAMEEAIERVIRDKPGAAQTFVAQSGGKQGSAALLLRILEDPETQFTLTPQNVMTFAGFLQRTGVIRTAPESWRELFFPEIHDRPGS